MRPAYRVIWLAFVLSCAESPELQAPPLPPPPNTPRPLQHLFVSTQSFWGPSTPEFADIRVDGGRLTVLGRHYSGSAPLRFLSVAATDYMDSLIVQLEYDIGTSAAVDAREYELAIEGLSDRPQWLRVRSCFRTCTLLRDTVLNAPYPGRRPAGWEQPLPRLPRRPL